MKAGVKSVLKLYFNKSEFLLEEKQHEADLDAEGRPVGEWDPKKEENRLGRIVEKRERLLNYLSIVLALFAAGGFTSAALRLTINIDVEVVRWVRVISLIIVSWAVLSKLEDIQTVGGAFGVPTHLEQTSSLSYKLFYCIGIYLGFLSLFLP